MVSLRAWAIRVLMATSMISLAKADGCVCPRPAVPFPPAKPAMARMTLYEVDYCKDHVTGHAQDLKIRFDKSCGSRWRTARKYEKGVFASKVQIPKGDTSGLVTSFYLSTLEGSGTQSEIDFEWLGKDNWGVQTNYYVNGIGGHEMFHKLSFDASLGLHLYTIDYQPNVIKWYIDGALLRTEIKRESQSFPSGAVYLYSSVWNAGSINQGSWAGRFTGRSFPYYARYVNTSLPVE